MAISWRFADWPLRAKMAALLVAASLLPLAIWAYIDLRQDQARMLDGMKDLLEARGDQIVRELDSFHRGYQRSADRMARFPDSAAYCAETPERRAALPRRDAGHSVDLPCQRCRHPRRCLARRLRAHRHRDGDAADRARPRRPAASCRRLCRAARSSPIPSSPRPGADRCRRSPTWHRCSAGPAGGLRGGDVGARGVAVERRQDLQRPGRPRQLRGAVRPRGHPHRPHLQR